MSSPTHLKPTFTLAATGDAIISRRLLPSEGIATEFDTLLEILREADATVTNFETLVPGDSASPSSHCGGTYMRSPPAVLDELTAMGCDLFSAATNHAFDYGHRGIEQTLEAFAERNLPVGGLGYNLYDARRPTYLETPAGRVALVSVCTSITSGSRAGQTTQAVGGRPGVNPLAVETVYQLPERYREQFLEIRNAVGFDEQMQSWLDRGLYINHDWDSDEYLHFGDMKFEIAETGGISYQIDRSDQTAVCEWIEEAHNTADWVIVTVHSHQGVDGRQNTTETPTFLREVAHTAVDAGANAVIGTGPHVLRGVERYNGAPIFYSLGNFILQDETIDRLPAENYRRYGLEEFTKPSQAFDARNHDSTGELMSDRANPECWITVVPVCTFDAEIEQVAIELHPVTLQQELERSQCGTPILATDEQATAILERVAERSAPFGTTLEIADGVGRIKPSPDTV